MNKSECQPTEDEYYRQSEREEQIMGMDRQMYEDDLIGRIRSGRTTDDDAKYVAWALGRTLPEQPSDITETRLVFQHYYMSMY